MPASPGDHAHEHEHGGGNGHSHAGHSHGVTADTNKRRLTVALGLIVAFMVGEVIAGILIGRSVSVGNQFHGVSRRH
jgi:cobalt-zinc-cadmium efflux system protein